MRKIIISLLILFLFLGISFYLTNGFDPLALNEHKILKETRKAYENAQFQKEPFLKKKEIQSLTEFLLRHVDEFKHYNRHAEYRRIQLTEGNWTAPYRNNDACFEMPMFHPTFIKEYIPPSLVDSLLFYSDKLKNDLIVGFSVCSKNYNENIDSTKGSVSFVINCEGKYEFNANYYLRHGITQNLKFKENKTLHSIYDFGLTKDTLLLDKLRYTISITPYSGF